MLDKQRSKQILALTVPILAGMLSQNILNLVDAAMVGSLGTAALGAVGIASFVNFFCAALFIGMASGIQAMVARNMGEGRESKAAYPLNGGLLLNILFAIPTTILLVHLSPHIMEWLVDDPEVIAQGTPYLSIRLIGLAALGCNFAYRGFWSSIGKPGLYLHTLIIMHSVNIFLNYVLIFGHFGSPTMGTAGAALGTIISMYLGTLYYTFLANKHGKNLGFARGLLSLKGIKSLLRISLPASFQQLFFAGGFTTLFWIIAKIGTIELAGANAIVNLTLVAILPCIAFGITANTMVSQALGKNDPEQAFRWGWDIAKLAFVVVFMIGLPMLLFPDFILRAFLTEQEAIDVARFPLRLVGFGIAMDAIALVLMSALQGAGAARQTMTVGLIMQWGIFLPIAFLLGPIMGLGLSEIWIAQSLYRLIQMLWFMALWNGKKWQSIKLHSH